MLCPFCQTENRDDQEACYHCTRDLSMLRLIVNKAKHHYNQGLEYAERGRLDDAIFELKNALELDATLAPAHVVLGTLYAKKEQFEQARESWHNALAIDHNFDKAHQYLEKAERAEFVFPAMRRLKVLALILLALAIVLAGALLYALLPEPGLATVRQAYRAALGEPPQMASALELIEQVQNSRRTSPMVHDFATRLAEHIERRWNATLAMAEQAREDAPEVTLQMLEALEAEVPPAHDVRLRAAKLRAGANQALMTQLEQSADRFAAGTLPFSEFQSRAERMLKVTRDAKQREAAQALLARASEQHRQAVIAQANAAVAAAPTTAEAVKAAVEWATREPELADSLDKLIDQRLATETSQLEAAIAQLLQENQPEQARARLAGLALLYRSARREPPTDHIQALAERITGHERAQALAQADAAWREERWEDFLARTEHLEELTQDEVELARLREMRQTAQRTFALDMWQWYEARDQAFESLTVSGDDAARAVRSVAAVLEGLPERHHGRGPVLFYAATAALRLNQPARARELLGRLKQEYPKSYVIRAANRFERQHAEALAEGGADAPALPEAAGGDASSSAPAASAPPATTADDEQTSPAEPQRVEPVRRKPAQAAQPAAEAAATAQPAPAATPAIPESIPEATPAIPESIPAATPATPATTEPPADADASTSPSAAPETPNE